MSKFYVVWSGRIPGVYRTWQECEQQVKGYSAKFKSFTDISEERAWELFEEGPVALMSGGANSKQKRKGTTQSKTPDYSLIQPGSWAVDAATSRNPGPMEYRGVDIYTGEVVFASKVYPLGTNNIGEFLAIVHALALMIQKRERQTIYTDSQNALYWVKAKVCRSKLPRTAETEELYRVVDRAVAFLNKYDLSQFDIRKWPTDEWGEIPADYGRK